MRRADGHRVFVVRNGFVTDIASLAGRVAPGQTRFPDGYHLVAQRAYPGLGATVVQVFAAAAPPNRDLHVGAAGHRRVRAGPGHRGHAGRWRRSWS